MLEYLLTLLHARFIGSVTIDESGIKWSSRSGSSANNSWTTSTASFSTFHSPAPQRLRPPRASLPPANGIRFAILWLLITATPKTTQFSFRRGRIMSPKTSSSLITARERSANRRSSTGWTLLLRRLLLLRLRISRGLGRAGWEVCLRAVYH